ncbi:serine/threonine-protein phosphatase 7 long form homolog [Cajanus cajan]|uniref:serine/threonine-protein phosphatase 7 long form homolog n=1 Tax=Cajanus cajan TaxID=3821 RepID=UPI0010FAEE40|nr:serine/threonine-protein phosphatase 7 long form homolog [Cajanus cajan]
MPRQRVNPGPIDDSLLTMQSIHVSEHIWNGEPDRVLRIRRATKSSHRDGSIPDEVRPYLAQAGMLGVVELSYFPIDHQLISALVERWRPETHTFHMTFGECTITLEDVSVLLGLKVYGDPITGCSTYRWVTLVEDLFGITPPPNAIKGGRLKMSWVDQHFFDVSMHVHSVQQMERYARAYILRLLGGMLLSDKSSTLVPMRYLVMLTNLDQCGQLSWRSALLAHLYREPCVATNYDNKEISGACVLLQLWAWYRMPYFAPLTAPLNIFGIPLGARWNSVLQVTQRTLAQIRDALDKMKDNDFVWQPYLQYFHSLPPYCVENTNIWRAVVPLIDFHIIEYHHADRVMRQFDMVQHIPRPPRQPDNLHDLTLRGKDDIDWRVQHAVFIYTDCFRVTCKNATLIIVNSTTIIIE